MSWRTTRQPASLTPHPRSCRCNERAEHIAALSLSHRPKTSTTPARRHSQCRRSKTPPCRVLDVRGTSPAHGHSYRRRDSSVRRSALGRGRCSTGRPCCSCHRASLGRHPRRVGSHVRSAAASKQGISSAHASVTRCECGYHLLVTVPATRYLARCIARGHLAEYDRCTNRSYPQRDDPLGCRASFGHEPGWSTTARVPVLAAIS
jgi:hypothetical protein